MPPPLPQNRKCHICIFHCLRTVSGGAPLRMYISRLPKCCARRHSPLQRCLLLLTCRALPCSRHMGGGDRGGKWAHRDGDGDRGIAAVVDVHVGAPGGPAHLLRVHNFAHTRAIDDGVRRAYNPRMSGLSCRIAGARRLTSMRAAPMAFSPGFQV